MVDRSYNKLKEWRLGKRKKNPKKRQSSLPEPSRGFTASVKR